MTRKEIGIRHEGTEGTLKEPPHEWLNKRKSKRPMACFLPRWNNEGWIYSPPSHTLKETDNQKNI